MPYPSRVLHRLFSDLYVSDASRTTWSKPMPRC